MNKSTELQRNLSRAHMWGSSLDLIHQLEWMLEMIEEEKMERTKKEGFQAMQAMFPPIIESDPEFKGDKSAVEDTNSTVVKPAARKPMNAPAPMFHKEYTKPKDGK